jgi:hypothetical protein
VTDAEWAAMSAGMQATWRDCHLAADDAADGQYRRALDRVPVGMLAAAIDILAADHDRFPSIADFVGLCRDLWREEKNAERDAALAHAALPAPKAKPQDAVDFDRYWDEIAATHKAELQEFARRQGLGPEWLARRFAQAERGGPVVSLLRQRVAGEIAPAEFSRRLKGLTQGVLA